ncbi:3'(2'),5'-bisphosphate nucleotidase CysQ [Candidatus Spongiihabitans sp.]|uniref:3'(2'),5'-bisphosphate nucleotidase CysQ n=1 Tax=Candidatus Spongiihabitans sp. TaxID=3101308 RepID=UPI003C7A1491
MKRLLEKTLDIAIEAGQQILSVYETEFEVEIKEDGSSVTLADQRAHELIEGALQKLDAIIPVMSEESSQEVFDERVNWRKFWLVDPLDGTKEFIKRSGEFTVNIALIENGAPILGVVHAPARDISHFAATGVGAFKQEGNQSMSAIKVREMRANGAIMVASRSHSGAEVARFRHNLEQAVGHVEVASMGSSLKICLVAEGGADIYPRLRPTCEWDTAAAQCVLEVAGGQITDLNGQRLKYNKPDILNPWFLASGDKSIDWTQYLD